MQTGRNKENSIHAVNVSHAETWDISEDLSKWLLEELELSKLNKILNIKSSILIYRYPSNVCNSCYLEDLNELLVLQESIGQQNILIIPAYPDDRNTRILLRNVLAKFNYRNISTDLIPIPIDAEGLSKRYFALTHSDGSVEMAFFPERGNVTLTRLYFKEIEERIKE